MNQVNPCSWIESSLGIQKQTCMLEEIVLTITIL